MSSGETPSRSINSDSNGNINPSAKPKTTIAAIAAARLTKRWLSIALTPDQHAARQGKAGEQDHIGNRNRNRKGADPERVYRRTCQCRTHDSTNSPHHREGGGARNKVWPMERIAHDCERHG